MSKIKPIPSGSHDIVEDLVKDEEEYLTIDDLNIDIEDIEKALKKMLGPDFKETLEIEASLPMYILSFEKDKEFFYSMNRKTFIQLKNNMEVIPVFEDDTKKKPVPGFYVINNEIFNIDPKKVICIGWN